MGWREEISEEAGHSSKPALHDSAVIKSLKHVARWKKQKGARV